MKNLGRTKKYNNIWLILLVLSCFIIIAINIWYIIYFIFCLPALILLIAARMSDNFKSANRYAIKIDEENKILYLVKEKKSIPFDKILKVTSSGKSELQLTKKSQGCGRIFIETYDVTYRLDRIIDAVNVARELRKYLKLNKE